MDVEFNNILELYERLTPALLAKEAELKRNDINYIKIEDIWNYLRISKWSKARNLLLYQMVDDILNVDNMILDNYVKDNIKQTRVQLNLDGEGFYE